MGKLTNLFKKELRELITPQTLAAMVIMVVMFVMLGFIIGPATQEMTRTVQEPKVAIIDLDKSERSSALVDMLRLQSNASVFEPETLEISEAIALTKEHDYPVLLKIPRGYGKSFEKDKPAEVEIYSLIEGFAVREMTSSASVQVIVEILNQLASITYIQEAIPGADPVTIRNPIKQKNYVVFQEKIVEGSPLLLTSLLTSQTIMVPLLMFIIILMTGQMVVTSMAMEKENKTLETLLTLPVKRSHIILSKLGASAVVAMLMAGLYMVGFGFYMRSIMQPTMQPAQQLMQGQLAGAGENIIEQLGLVLSVSDYIMLGISLFFAIMVGLSMSMIIGVYSQDVKSAQMLIGPLIFLAIIPFMLLMFSDFGSLQLPLKILIFAIPFSHPIIASRALLFNQNLLVAGGIVYLVAITCILLWITVRIFNTDRILTARVPTLKKRRKKEEPSMDIR
jgi:ABC-2 type transport system permease protein